MLAWIDKPMHVGVRATMECPRYISLLPEKGMATMTETNARAIVVPQFPEGFTEQLLRLFPDPYLHILLNSDDRFEEGVLDLLERHYVSLCEKDQHMARRWRDLLTEGYFPGYVAVRARRP